MRMTLLRTSQKLSLLRIAPLHFFKMVSGSPLVLSCSCIFENEAESIGPKLTSSISMRARQSVSYMNQTCAGDNWAVKKTLPSSRNSVKNNDLLFSQLGQKGDMFDQKPIPSNGPFSDKATCIAVVSRERVSLSLSLAALFCFWPFQMQ